MAPDLGPVGSRDPLRAIYERDQRRPHRSRLLAAAAAVLVLGAFAVIVYYAYHEGMRAGSAGVAPLIKAEPQPYKVKPEEPGGMEVPHQDKLIYNEVTRQGGEEGKPQVERLLPPPEQPIAKPAEDAPAGKSGGAAGADQLPGSQGSAGQPAAPAASAPQPAAPPASLGTKQAEPSGASPGPPSAALPPAGGANQQAAAPGPVTVQPPAQAAKPAAASTKLTARPDPGSWRVQLGAMRVAEDARHEWERLQKKHRELLGALALSVQRVDLGAGKGVFYRIQGGPLADRDAANALCDRLKAVKVGCLAVKP